MASQRVRPLAVTDIQAIGGWKTNGEMIADVARLGYIPEPVIDLTYGAGNFWTEYCPKWLARNDLFKRELAHTCYDFRHTQLDSGSFATVVFDPPYKLAGTPQSGQMDYAFGTDVVRTRSEILSLLVGGIAEGSRLTNHYLLVKTADMVSSGQVRWQTQAAIDTARALELNLVDSFLFRAGRPQPEGRRQIHARREYSTLLVFSKKRG